MTRTIAKTDAPHAPSGVERAVGILFAFLVLALVAALAILEIDVKPGMQQLLNVLLALMAAAVAATVPGFINISYSAGGVALRAAGGAAVMLAVMHFLTQAPAAGSVELSPQPSRQAVRAEQPARKPAPRVEKPQTAWTAPQQTLWRAESWCPMTGASGWATSARGAQDAGVRAVQACVLYGGLPECCATNVRLAD